MNFLSKLIFVFVTIPSFVIGLLAAIVVFGAAGGWQTGIDIMRKWGEG